MPLSQVPGAGIEPALPNGNRILSPARLPVPPSGLVLSFPKADAKVNFNNSKSKYGFNFF